MTKARNIAELANDISVDNNRDVTLSNLRSDQPMTFRNRIINGDMRIDQRNAGAAVTTTGAYPVDRFPTTHVSDGAFSAQQDSSAPVGFNNSVKFTVTTADSSIGSTKILLFRQFIEGNNIADLGWGTANAKTVTLSFWVRSSVTGTFGGSIGNNANDRYYSYSYSISSVDTWEYKTVTIAGDTTGTWLTNTGIGLRVYFGLTVGSERTQSAGLWSTPSSPFIAGVTGQVQLLETPNATWYITGVQLEEGTVPTPFEHRPYGTELALCQRYFQKIDNGGTGNHYTNFGLATSYAAGTYTFRFPVPLVTKMRSYPSFFTTGNIVTLGVVSSSTTLRPADGGGNPVFGLELSATAGASNQTVIVRGDNDPTAALNFNAELL